MMCFNVKTHYSFHQSTTTLKELYTYWNQWGWEKIAYADSSPYAKEMTYYSSLPLHWGIRLRIGDIKKRVLKTSIAVYPLNERGIEAVHYLVEKSTEQYYYTPRISLDDCMDIIMSPDSIIVAPYGVCKKLKITQYESVYYEASVAERLYQGDIHKYVWAQCNNYSICDVVPSPTPHTDVSVYLTNNYTFPKTRHIYELHAHTTQKKSYIEQHTYPQWILSYTALSQWCAPYVDSSCIDINTKRVSDMIRPIIPKKSSFPTPKGNLSEKYITKEKAHAELMHQLQICTPATKEYTERVTKELDILWEKGFMPYMVLVAETVAYAKQHMLVGPGRGSSAGCLIAYLMGITMIDSVKYGLLFERFLSMDRIDPPDIDIDFDDEKRYMILDYYKRIYGEKCVYHIGTLMVYRMRTALEKINRIMPMHSHVMDQLKQQCDTYEGDIVSHVDGDERIKWYVYWACHITGLLRTEGVHASGIAICDGKMSEFACIDARNTTVCITNTGLDALGILKIDILGLKTLNIVQRTLNSIGMSRETFLEKVTQCNDPHVFDCIKEGNVYGLFQFDSPITANVITSVYTASVHGVIDVPIDYHFVSFCTALARPGAFRSGGVSTMIQSFQKGKQTHAIPLYDTIVGATYGTIVYQEQVMEIFSRIGGFDDVCTAQVRKAMSKTVGDVSFLLYKDDFLKGAQKNHYTKEHALSIWESICQCGSWVFNKSHSYAYSALTYWTQYLKTYHPFDFTCALLQRTDDSVDIAKSIQQAKKHHAIDFEYSDYTNMKDAWYKKGTTLYAPLTLFHGVGPKKAAAMLTRIAQKRETVSDKKILQQVITLPIPSVLYPNIYTSPKEYKIVSPLVTEIKNAVDSSVSVFVAIVTIITKKMNNVNDAKKVTLRGKKVDVSQCRFEGLFPVFTVFDGYTTHSVFVSYMSNKKKLWDLYYTYPVDTWILAKIMIVGDGALCLENYRVMEEIYE